MSSVRPGIFCVEGAWSPKLTDPTTVRPLLEFLKVMDVADFIHRQVETGDTLLDLACRWGQKQYARFTIGYFAFHGAPGMIALGRGREVDLEAFAGALVGRVQGKVCCFGSCSVLKVAEAEVIRLFHPTGIKAVVGYDRTVDWVESAAFEILLFKALRHYQRVHAAEQRLRRDHPGLTERLGFRVIYPQRDMRHLA